MAAYNTSGPVNQLFVSALSVYDREVYRKLFHKDPEKSFFGTMRALSMMTATPQREFEHFEDGSIFESVTISAAGAALSGGNIVFAVDASEVRSGKIYPLVGNTVEFVDGQQGRIQSIAGATVTVAPYARNGANAIVPFTVTGIAAGSKVMVFASAFAEGTDQPGSRKRTPESFKNTTQIFKHDYVIYGSEESTTIVLDLGGRGGYGIMGEEDTAFRHEAELDMGLLFGKGGETVDENGNPVYLTKGLLQHGRDRGINIASWQSLSDIDDSIRLLNKKRAPSEYALWNGIEVELKLDSILNNTKLHEAIQYNGVGGKQVAESLGFQSFRKSGYSFHANRLDIFNHDRLAAQDGFKYSSSSLGVPLHQVKDTKTGEDSYAVNIRYKQGNGINRFNKVWETGANAAQNKTSIDERRVHYLTEAGLQVKGADLLLMQTAA